MRSKRSVETRRSTRPGGTAARPATPLRAALPCGGRDGVGREIDADALSPAEIRVRSSRSAGSPCRFQDRASATGRAGARRDGSRAASIRVSLSGRGSRVRCGERQRAGPRIRARRGRARAARRRGAERVRLRAARRPRRAALRCRRGASLRIRASEVKSAMPERFEHRVRDATSCSTRFRPLQARRSASRCRRRSGCAGEVLGPASGRSVALHLLADAFLHLDPQSRTCSRASARDLGAGNRGAPATRSWPCGACAGWPLSDASSRPRSMCASTRLPWALNRRRQRRHQTRDRARAELLIISRLPPENGRCSRQRARRGEGHRSRAALARPAGSAWCSAVSASMTSSSTSPCIISSSL
jgi:hypothetical protein